MNKETRMVENLIAKYPQLKDSGEAIFRAFERLKSCYQGRGKVLVCGNGGSSADADHLVAELMKGFEAKRPLSNQFLADLKRLYPEDAVVLYELLQGALPAIALSAHVALCSAIANDNHPSMIFAQQVIGYGAPGDVLIAISTSGSSLNVVNAAKVACAKGLRTIAITGRTGGRLGWVCDLTICVPADTASEVQELQLPIYHTLCRMLESHFFPQTRS